MKQLIIFGAGKRGVEIMKKHGKENVAFFCDNASQKWDTMIDGKTIVSFEKFMKMYDREKHTVIVSPVDFAIIAGQLEKNGVRDYIVYNSLEKINQVKRLKDEEKTYYEQNQLLDYFASQCSAWDLLEDCTGFIQLTKEVLKSYKEGLVLRHFGIGGEGNFYGNLDALLKYAQYDNFDKVYAPNVSHNAGVPIKRTETMYSSAAVFSGIYYKERIHQWRPYIPVFTVGPYIQYVNGIYTKEKVESLKKKNGKTLTVFLPHSIEYVGRNYKKEEFIDDVLKLYQNQFDTFILCVYWADILEPVCNYALSKKMKIVSAGYRFDSMFDRRLRSIFDLSDAIIGGDFGTHFVYAFQLGIKAARINISNNQTIIDDEISDIAERQVQFDEYYRDYQKGFFEYYDSEFKCTSKQREWLNPYAGFGVKRSVNYMHNIFDISQDILIECEGNLDDYPEAVKRVYKQYNKKNDIDKMSILAEATGNYLYY